MDGKSMNSDDEQPAGKSTELERLEAELNADIEDPKAAVRKSVLLKYMAEARADRDDIIEMCAKLIEENMLCDDLEGGELLMPRTNPGNRVGFAYAKAIRSLKSQPAGRGSDGGNA